MSAPAPDAPSAPEDGPCRRCGEPYRPVDAVTVALVVVLAVVIICYLARGLCARRREGFASQRAQEVYRTSASLFEKTRGGATYSDFKSSERAADPVLYTDVRNLWRDGRLTPETVESVL